MKTIIKIMAGLIAAALFVYGIGWGITDNYNFKEWGKVAEDEPPAEKYETDGYEAGEVYVIYTEFQQHKHPSAEEMRAEGQYIITFHTAGGEYVDSLLIDGGAVPELPETTRAGYDFIGWYKQGGEKYGGEPITEDTILVAHWEWQTLTVTFYAGDKIYKNVNVMYGDRLARATDKARIFSNNIISFQNANVETPDIPAAEMTVTDNMIVRVNKPTLAELITKSKIIPMVMASVGGFVLIVLSVMVDIRLIRGKKHKSEFAFKR